MHQCKTARSIVLCVQVHLRDPLLFQLFVSSRSELRAAPQRLDSTGASVSVSVGVSPCKQRRERVKRERVYACAGVCEGEMRGESADGARSCTGRVWVSEPNSPSALREPERVYAGRCMQAEG